MSAAVKLPPNLYRVVYEQGYGWPRCTHRERTQRTYGEAAGALRMVETLDRFPDHHRLVGVYATPCHWRQVEREALAVEAAAEKVAS